MLNGSPRRGQKRPSKSGARGLQRGGLLCRSFQSVRRTERPHSDATSKAIDESKHRISVAKGEARMWSHAKQRGALGLTAGGGSGLARSRPRPRSVPASHCFHRSETGGQSWGGRPGFLEAGVSPEGPSHSPDSPAHCHLSPSPGRCHTRRGKTCPEPHLQDGRGASLGGLVPWALVTSLHRPVCPTSQEPESPLAGEPVAVRGLCVSHLRSPPWARGLSGLAERHRGRETRRILRHPVCPLSRRLLGAGTQEEPPPPCLRILGFGGSA